MGFGDPQGKPIRSASASEHNQDDSRRPCLSIPILMRGSALVAAWAEGSMQLLQYVALAGRDFE
jgi:hypothetical protein